MARCQYCEREAYGQPICHKHQELRAIAFVLQQQGRPVTTGSVRNHIELLSDPISIQPAEIPLLLRQMKSQRSRSIQRVSAPER